MPENYYLPNSLYPDITYIVLERLQAYICGLIYPNEDFSVSKKRFVLADFGAGEEVAIRRAIETFPTGNNTVGSQSSFPFTCYNVGEEEQVEYRSHLQKSALYYADDLGSYITAVPVKLTFPMITFYNTAADFRRFDSMVQLDDANLTRLWCPCVINNKTNYFPLDVDFDISKGEFAFAFEQHLSTGKIFDVVHNITAYFHKLVLVAPSQVSGTGHQEAVPVYPVDDIIFSLKDFDSKQNIKTVHSPDTPIVTSSLPTNGETGFDKHGTPIIINFNVAMNEQAVLSNLDIVPSVTCDKMFNTGSTQLVIDPRFDLESNTKYTILINNNAKSSDGVPLENDYSLTFTTEV